MRRISHGMMVPGCSGGARAELSVVLPSHWAAGQSQGTGIPGQKIKGSNFSNFYYCIS